MARQCKCQVTGERGTTDSFYKAPNGKYYKTKEIYEAWENNNKFRSQVIDKFSYEYLDYVPGQIFPTLFFRKLKELEFYGYEIIYKTMCKCDNNIQWSIKNKEFKNEAGKISYIFAIIKNNINDVYKEKNIIQKKNNIAPAEIDITYEDELFDIGTHIKGNDISEFLN